MAKHRSCLGSLLGELLSLAVSISTLNLLILTFCSFGLGSLSLTLPIGKIYTLFNAKVLYLGFLAIFMLGSALCGAAWNMNALIIGRVLAGVGGIGVYTGIMTILTSLTTEKERPVYLGVM